MSIWNEHIFDYLLECDGDTYGQNCRSLCGHCFDEAQCHYVNGTCPNGCDGEYQGSHCTQGDDHFIHAICQTFFAVLQS